MCDYCDCRRIDEIADLGAEHDRIEELADRVLTAVKNGDSAAGERFTELIELLTAHVEREEAGIFVEARTAGLASYYVEDLEEDHRNFAATLADPLRLSPAEIERLFDDLHRHIAIEEYDLFPAAAQVLTEVQWERIASSG